MDKRYHIILKTGYFEKGEFVKYHSVNDLLRFLDFINKKWPDWVFFHVYEKEGGALLETFKRTKHETKLPTSRYLRVY